MVDSDHRFLAATVAEALDEQRKFDERRTRDRERKQSSTSAGIPPDGARNSDGIPPEGARTSIGIPPEIAGEERRGEGYL